MACLLKDEERVEFSNQSTPWKIIFEPLTGIVVISKADGLMYIVLSKAEKHVPCGQLVCTTECITEVLHKQRAL
jgi:hypothetical protein